MYQHLVRASVIFSPAQAHSAMVIEKFLIDTSITCFTMFNRLVRPQTTLDTMIGRQRLLAGSMGAMPMIFTDVLDSRTSRTFDLTNI